MRKIFFDEEQLSLFDDDIRGCSIPGDVKKRVYERDNNRCQVTGATKNLSCHHLIAASKGGSATPENLLLVCRDWHDYLHLQTLPNRLYVPQNFYSVTRLDVLRNLLRINAVPEGFDCAYDCIRKALNGINDADPNNPFKVEVFHFYGDTPMGQLQWFNGQTWTSWLTTTDCTYTYPLMSTSNAFKF